MGLSIIYDLFKIFNTPQWAASVPPDLLSSTA
jgi:hypothetical protein